MSKKPTKRTAVDAQTKAANRDAEIAARDAEAAKVAARRFWAERDATAALIRRCWTHRRDWMATTGESGAFMDLDAIGYTLGVSSDEARDLCELGILPARQNDDAAGCYGWDLSTADFARWLEEFGPEWFEARAERAQAEIQRGMRRRTAEGEREAHAKFSAALAGLLETTRARDGEKGRGCADV